MVWASDGLGILAASEDFSEIKHSRILSMSGVPVEELLLKLNESTPSENMEWVKAKAPDALYRQSVLKHILGKQQMDALTLEIERDGVRQEVSLPFGFEIITGDSGPQFSQFFWDVIPELKAGYFSLKSCNDTEDYRRSVQKLFLEMEEHGCENLIIDLRGNGGGNSSVVNEFLRKMPGKEFLHYGGRIRMNKYVIEQLMGQLGYDKSSVKIEGESNLSVTYSEKWHKPTEDQMVTPFEGKVYILVDRNTFSSGNWLAVIFSDNRLGTVVGEKTGNAPSSYGEVLGFDLLGMFRLSMSSKIWVRPDPSRDPADGLVPDIEIPTTLADVFAGRDPQMEWLIKELYPDKEKSLSEEEINSLMPKAPESSE
jgi:C-terminal processing protease CtpA/Prc